MSNAVFDIETYRGHVARYGAELPRYEALAKVVHRALTRATRDLGMEAIVQSRAKQKTSFAEKSIRKQSSYPDPVNMMTDLCGVRVITESTNDVAPVCAFIRKHFEIDEDENVASRLGVGEFGYLSVHFIVSLKEGAFAEERRAVVQELLKNDPDAENTVAALFERRTPDECRGKPYGPGPRYRAEIQVRSLLQHAWAALSHDRVYKSKFDVPVQLKRKLNRIAAALEEADEDFAHALDSLTSYEEYYGAYMPRDLLARELEKLKIVRTFDRNNRALAAKVARIAVSLERWKDVDEALCAFVSRWDDATLGTGQDMATKGKTLDAAIAAVTSDSNPIDRKTAEEAIEGLRQAGVAAMFLDLGVAKSRMGQTELGRAYLRRAAALEPNGADALTAWAETYEDEDADVALDLYRRAFEVCPHDPRALAGFMCFRAADERDLDSVDPMRPTLESAIQCCRERVSVGTYMPWAYYDIGFFSLLLGRPYESLCAYARAVELSLTASPIDRTLERVQRLRKALKKTGMNELEWVENFLLIARVAKLDRLYQVSLRDVSEKQKQLEACEQSLREQKDREGAEISPDRIGRMNKDIESARDALVQAESHRDKAQRAAAEGREDSLKQLPSSECPPIRGKVVIVAGGCDRAVQKQVAAYAPILREAFSDFGGTVFSGGTQDGVAGIVGDLPDSSRGPILKIACLPKDFPHWHIRHEAYSAYYIPGSRFSAHGPIQVWTDILRANLNPADVRVLGINGGRISAFEYRLGLMMGARTGVIKDSGRAAEDICKDPDWHEHPCLLQLPYDPQTVRVFAAGFSSEGILSEKERLAMAETAHKKNVERRIRESMIVARPENRDWQTLREDLRQSILDRMDFIVDRLRSVGLRIVKELPDGVAPIAEFADEHGDKVERMAEMEHGRWVIERLASGWKWGETKDPGNRMHPCLVPWAILPEDEKDKDRHYAREVPAVLRDFGYFIVPVE